jgi:hypothetical protein
MKIKNSDQQEVADGNLLLGCVKSIQDLRSTLKDLVKSVKTIQAANDYIHLRVNEISGIVQEFKSSTDISEVTNGVGRNVTKTMADVDEYVRCKFQVHFNVVQEASPLNLVMYDRKIYLYYLIIYN